MNTLSKYLHNCRIAVQSFALILCIASSPDASGIHTSAYRENGWWQDGAPLALPASAYSPEVLAVTSPGCRAFSNPVQERQAYCRSRGGYEGIHLFLSLDNSVLLPAAEAMWDQDPWQSGFWLAGNSRNILFREVTQLPDLKELMVSLLMDCKVIDQVFIWTHGDQNSISIRGRQGIDMYSVGEFFSRITPCAFSPHARIQFVSCNVACGSSALRVREDLSRVFLDPKYQPDSHAPPFYDLRVLFNSADGHDWDATHRRLEVRSLNDLGIQYSVRSNAIEMDVAPEAVPACPYRARSIWLEDAGGN